MLKFINRPAREENYLNNNNDDNFIECQCHPILHQNSDQRYENRVKVSFKTLIRHSIYDLQHIFFILILVSEKLDVKRLDIKKF